MHHTWLRENRLPFALLAGVVLVYAVLYAHVYAQYRFDPNVHGVDTRWTAVGEQLYLEGVYSRGDRDSQGVLLPTLDPPPVYPFMHWLSYTLFGLNVRALEAVRIVQIVMVVCMIFVCFQIGKAFSRKLGYATAIVAFLDLTMFYFALNYRVPNVPTAFFLTLSLLYLVRFLKVQQSRKNVFLCALFLVLAFHTRIALYLLWVPVLLLIVAFLFKDGAFDRRRLALAAIFFVVTNIAFWGWKVRNYVQAESFQFSSQSGEVYLDYRAGFLLARMWRVSHSDAIVILRREHYTKVADLPEGPKNLYLAKVGRDIIRTHPLAYVQVAFAGTPALLFGAIPPYLFFNRDTLGTTFASLAASTGTLSFLGQLWEDQRRSYILIYGLTKAYLVLLYLTGLFGVAVWWIRKCDRWLLAALLVLIAYLFLSSATPDATARYRAPFMAVFYVLSGYGITSISDWLLHIVRTRRAAALSPVDQSR